MVFALFVTTPAFGQLSERTGLKQDFAIETGGYNFVIEVTSTFNVEAVEFSAEDKKLTLRLSNSIENNLGEIQIPKNLINGNFTFFLNDQEIFPVVKTNDKISFITLNFKGDGKHTLQIIGTTYLPEFSDVAPLMLLAPLFGIVLLKLIKKQSSFLIIH